MTRVENHCVDCGLHCLGSSCRYRNVEVHYCDKCHKEIEDIYEVDGEEICESCLKKMFKKEGD